jgi:hypothetical protein
MLPSDRVDLMAWGPTLVTQIWPPGSGIVKYAERELVVPDNGN